MGEAGKSEKRHVVLAIDPGREKCGLAVVAQDGEIIARLVVQTPLLVSMTKNLYRKFMPDILLIGNGTGSKPIRDALLSENLPVPVEAVEEAHTSEAARKRFVAENPAKGWQRFLPRSLRTPDVPYDDYVAVILAERYFAQYKILENVG